MLIPLTENYRGIDEPGSHGPYQIRQAYLNDVNRFSHCNYTVADCYNPVLAKRIVTIYLTHYCTVKRLGHEPTVRDYCRTHCAGPTGWKQKCSMAYWQKARLFMDVAMSELKAKEKA
jgi:hypothetical protein